MRSPRRPPRPGCAAAPCARAYGARAAPRRSFDPALTWRGPGAERPLLRWPPCDARILLIASLLIAGAGARRVRRLQLVARAPRPSRTPTEQSPPGDIPDNQAFVRYTPPRRRLLGQGARGLGALDRGRRGHVHRQAQHASGRAGQRRAAPDRAPRPRAVELPKLAQSVQGFKPGTVTHRAARTAGTAIRITYLADAPAEPGHRQGVHGRGRALRLLPQRQGGVLTLSGPKGADNVDPWRIVTDSVRWSA